jgi:uncharacterized repeat protein (TIGR03987 family)
MTINTMLFFAVIIVTFAMLFYSIAVIAEQRTSVVSRVILLFLTAGVFCDVTATILMIIGSRNTPVTIHGVLGYTALIAMLSDTVIIWRYWINSKGSFRMLRQFHLYTRIAYIWWITAYIAGALVAFIK